MIATSKATSNRVPLRKYTEQIGHWAAEGKDDEWIASTLGSSASSIQSFRSRHRIPHYKRRSEPPEVEEGLPEASAAYEGVLERDHDENGRERWVVWFDAAIADAPEYQRWTDRRLVMLTFYNEKITVAPAPRTNATGEHLD